jgi:hypothetical protein
MSLAQEVFGAPAAEKAKVSIMSREAAIEAARYHAARASSPALRAYWETVISSLVGGPSCQ